MKPSSLDETAPGKVNFVNNRVVFECGSKDGGTMRMSGSVQSGDEYVLIFENGRFRLEKASRVTQMRAEINRNPSANDSVS